MKRTLLVLGLSIGLLVGLSSFVLAASTENGLTGLAVTSSADVLEQGKFNVGGHFLHATKEENNVTASMNLIPMTLTYGVMPNLEVAGMVPYTSWKAENGAEISESGLGDVEILGKYKVMEAAKGMPAVALEGMVKLATGDDEKGLGSGAMDFGVGAAVSIALGKANGHGNLGYAIRGEDDDKFKSGNEILYNLAIDYMVSPKLTLFGELNGIKAGEAEYEGDTLEDTDSNEVYLGPGARFTLQPGVDIDIDGIIKFGVTDDAADWMLGIGGSAEF
ncbi:MAG: transporter [bacterium]|nr:transporter [bacterium]